MKSSESKKFVAEKRPPEVGGEFFDDDETKEKAESTEKKKINVSEIGEIEYLERRVMFPEKIVAETGGVKGYIRKTIPWEEIKRILGFDPEEYKRLKMETERLDKEIEKINNEIEKLDPEYRAPFHKIPDQLVSLISSKEEYREKCFEERKAESKLESEMENRMHVENGNNNKLIKILQTLSNGAYGKSLAIHYGHLKEDFTSSRGLLQKIGRPTRISNPEIFGEVAAGGLYAVDKKTNELIPAKNIDKELENKRDSSGLKVILGGHFYDKKIIKKLFFDLKDKLFYVSVLSEGLSVSIKNSLGWRIRTGPYNLYDCFFAGFNQDNSAFKNYLQKTKDLYQDVIFPQVSKIKIPSGESSYYSYSQPKDYLLQNVDYFLGNRSDFLPFDDEAMSHPRIPVVFNNPDISELRWCHAQYVFLSTKKGLNVIEMIT
jgi:hypothetical protein